MPSRVPSAVEALAVLELRDRRPLFAACARLCTGVRRVLVKEPFVAKPVPDVLNQCVVRHLAPRHTATPVECLDAKLVVGRAGVVREVEALPSFAPVGHLTFEILLDIPVERTTATVEVTRPPQFADFVDQVVDALLV